MQGYHFSARKPISRGKGKSAVAKAAYNGREALRDERTGELKDYSRTHDNVMFSGIFVNPKRNAPEWVQDRAQLWNTAAKAEKRKDAQEAQEIIIALPHQLTDKGREYVVKDFLRETIMRDTGRAADVNIHRPPKNGDERNYHVHILLTMRDIGPHGFSAKKAPEIDDAQLAKWKANFSNRAARELRKEGFDIEADRWAVGHLSKPEQLKDALRRQDFEHAAWAEMEATKHRGPAATGMDRKAAEGKGPQSDRGTIERERKAAEVERMKLAREMKEAGKTIAALERELAAPERKPEAEQQKQMRTTTAPQHHFADAAHTATRQQAPRMPFGLRGTSADIWEAYNTKAWVQSWQEQRSDGTTKTVEQEIHTKGKRDPLQFAAALEAKGIRLARATRDDAERSHREAQFAKENGGFAARYREGELVAVNRFGNVYALNERNTGESRSDVQRFLAKADWKGLGSVEGTRDTARAQAATREKQWKEKREVSEQAWKKRGEEIAAARMERATNPGKIPQDARRVATVAGRATIATGKEAGKVAAAAVGSVRAIARPPKSVRAAGKALGKALDIVGGLVESLAAPPKPLTRAEREEIHRRHEAEADRQQIDLNKYLYDTDAERAAAIQQQQEREQKTQREEYERLRGRERER